MTDEERVTTAEIAGEQDAREESTRDQDTRDQDTRDRDTRDEDRKLTRDTNGDRQGEPLAPLFDDADTTRFRDRWHELQTAFVDEPREAVAKADELVAELMQQLAKRFNQERSALEGQWSRGEDVSTEDLRVSLQRYRSFFERLLAA
jgi:hypothetical protein